VAGQTSRRTSSTREGTSGAVPLASRLVVTASCIAAIVALTHGIWEDRSPTAIVPAIALSPTPSAAPPANPLPATEQPNVPAIEQADVPPTNPPRPTTQPGEPTVAAPRIGIVAGHWGHDTGAMCPDGLMEVDINLDIAQRAVTILQALGYQADLLAEFDPRLEDYQADALLSIHADSCDVFTNATPPASGFKVASVEDSLVPEAEDRLVACLAQCYAARTGMFFHATSITFDMTRYHTFYEIEDQTPAAIIEVGFMYNDRTMLTQRADLVAQGIVDGIICFTEGETDH
jgi:N-acetylmuramoyl-L-alanine amidase